MFDQQPPSSILLDPSLEAVSFPDSPYCNPPRTSLRFLLRSTLPLSIKDPWQRLSAVRSPTVSPPSFSGFLFNRCDYLSSSFSGNHHGPSGTAVRMRIATVLYVQGIRVDLEMGQKAVIALLWRMPFPVGPCIPAATVSPPRLRKETFPIARVGRSDNSSSALLSRGGQHRRFFRGDRTIANAIEECNWFICKGFLIETAVLELVLLQNPKMLIHCHLARQFLRVHQSATCCYPCGPVVVSFEQ